MKTILLTGATDGIGLETAQWLVRAGHRVLLHGRSADKLQSVKHQLSALPGAGLVESYQADLSIQAEVEALANAIVEQHQQLDVLINNAGVLKAPDTVTTAGLDLRFMVNTIAPWLLTQRLLPLLGRAGRVINLSSAAQNPVNLDALAGKVRLDDVAAYAQSKLALTMWSRHLADTIGRNGPVIVAVNPGSLLGSKMVKEGFGVQGKDLEIGADILLRAALSDEFADASGRYFDNDAGRFNAPHPDALNADKNAAVVAALTRLAS